MSETEIIIYNAAKAGFFNGSLTAYAVGERLQNLLGKDAVVERTYMSHHYRVMCGGVHVICAGSKLVPFFIMIANRVVYV